jgi:regulatory protein YycI of two-component signal transduction system YycFG
MRRIIIAGLIVLSIFVVFNCSKKSQAKSEPIINPRNEFVEKLKAQIDQWNVDLDKISVNAQKLKGNSKVQADKQIAMIRSQQDELKTNLEKIQNSTDDAWDDLKKGAEDTRDKIGKAFTDVQKDLK